MRYLFITLSLLLLVAAPLGSQTQTTVVVASEAILNTFSVTLRGLPVKSTNASSATDCTFGSGTGNYIVWCHWCDSESIWEADGLECVAVTQSWTNNAATVWTNNAASAWTNN